VLYAAEVIRWGALGEDSSNPYILGTSRKATIFSASFNGKLEFTASGKTTDWTENA
jgi:hypothetical protein